MLFHGIARDSYSLSSQNYFTDKSKLYSRAFRILQTKVNLIIMGRAQLGEFEELVLLTVGVLYDDAYAVAITKELIEQSGRKIQVSAVHKSLYRLEEKGMLASRLGDPESKRGGKRKRLFTITPYGKKALDESMDLRASLRNQIPKLAFNWPGRN